jgi:hypothetical protein
MSARYKTLSAFVVTLPVLFWEIFFGIRFCSRKSNLFHLKQIIWVDGGDVTLKP